MILLLALITLRVVLCLEALCSITEWSTKAPAADWTFHLVPGRRLLALMCKGMDEMMLERKVPHVGGNHVTELKSRSLAPDHNHCRYLGRKHPLLVAILIKLDREEGSVNRKEEI
jgi:hypothetical protein